MRLYQVLGTIRVTPTDVRQTKHVVAAESEKAARECVLGVEKQSPQYGYEIKSVQPSEAVIVNVS